MTRSTVINHPNSTALTNLPHFPQGGHTRRKTGGLPQIIIGNGPRHGRRANPLNQRMSEITVGKSDPPELTPNLQQFFRIGVRVECIGLQSGWNKNQQRSDHAGGILDDRDDCNESEKVPPVKAKSAIEQLPSVRGAIVWLTYYRLYPLKLSHLIVRGSLVMMTSCG
jgi:hypothetical protein